MSDTTQVSYDTPKSFDFGRLDSRQQQASGTFMDLTYDGYYDADDERSEEKITDDQGRVAQIQIFGSSSPQMKSAIVREGKRQKKSGNISSISDLDNAMANNAEFAAEITGQVRNFAWQGQELAETTKEQRLEIFTALPWLAAQVVSKATTAANFTSSKT